MHIYGAAVTLQQVRAAISALERHPRSTAVRKP
jgi:hypothetical protein